MAIAAAPPIPVHRRFSPSPSREANAGLRAAQHYRRSLPAWRYELRQRLIPIVRLETPYLAQIQAACRTPLLDSYFAFTAQLGTHTFFMTFLPICFWCGYPDAGMALVHMLGLGVYLSGVIKDLVGLPRPLSPPLQRITMSGSAALEYGFPSTHTTNAVSVAIYYFHLLYTSRQEWPTLTYYLLCAACCCYATSITIGRVYCGMHGFSDVVVGAILGAVIAWIRLAVGAAFDIWVVSATWLRPAFTVLLLILAVRFHPQPADNCPCFDDSVAFLGVIMGVEIGTWHYASTQNPSPQALNGLASVYPYTNSDLLKSAARLVGGVVTIFLWRALAKPLLLRLLPPIFRSIDRIGLIIPRRYFLQAPDYSRVPPLRRDDNVLPAVAEIPAWLSSMRHPRSRRVSIGPQSEADARELMAQRRQQQHGPRAPTFPTRVDSLANNASKEADDAISPASRRLNATAPEGESALLSPPATRPSSLSVDDPGDSKRGSSDGDKDDEEREMFAALQKPRVRYDVEVVTKLVVYAGIAWLAVEGNPLWFRALGLA